MGVKYLLSQLLNLEVEKAAAGVDKSCLCGAVYRKSSLESILLL